MFVCFNKLLTCTAKSIYECIIFFYCILRCKSDTNHICLRMILNQLDFVYFIQVTPSATELAHIHRQMWKASDLKRMELVVLGKLSWKLWPVTCPTILKSICDILNIVDPSLPETMIDELLHKFEICINYSDCVVYSVSLLLLLLSNFYLFQQNTRWYI